jgi:sugar lactone lactonase YvrE
LIPMLMIAVSSTPAEAQLIDTWAGRGPYTTPVAASAANVNPWPIAVSPTSAANFPGSVYFADHSAVYRYDPAPKTVTLVAAMDTDGCNGNNIAATSAHIGTASGLALDSAETLYIADYSCGQIWRVTTAGVISSLPTGLSGAAPYYLHVDAMSGDLLVADLNIGVYSVNLSTGAATLLPGNGNATFFANGRYPEAITSDAVGNVYVIATQFSIPGYATAPDLLYRATKSGAVTQLATLFYCSEGLAIDDGENLYTADYCYNNVYQYAHSTGKVTAVAGTGGANNGGYSPDGTLATKAHLGDPADVAIDFSGTIYVTEFSNWQVRTFTLGGKLATLVGNEDGVGGTATSSWFYGRESGCLLADDPSNNLYFDPFKVASSGTISLFVDRGGPGFSGDGGVATNALTAGADCVATDSTGTIYLGDGSNNRVRKINSSGIISTIAGNGHQGFATSGKALSADISNPGPIAIDASGNVYFGEKTCPFDYCGSNLIVKLTNGTLSLLSGSTVGGYGGDGGIASSAALNGVQSLAFDAADNLYIADTKNQRIRKINASGVITTVAGNGNAGYSGDGGAAIAAELNFPRAVAVDMAGDLFITDSSNNRVRKVSASSGLISTIAGTGVAGFAGDGGIATVAELNFPTSMAIDPSGTLYVLDSNNNRIRRIRGANDTSPPAVTAKVTPSANNNGWNNANVSLSWSVSDAQSGIQSSTGCGPSLVTADTDRAILSCTATSIGGTTSKSVAIRRDSVTPTISITSPTSGGRYALGSKLLAGYACHDTLSGIATCVGSVANGAAIATSKAGSFSFAVTAADKAGNKTTKTVSYTIQ